jgi:hypothetical protein
MNERVQNALNSILLKFQSGDIPQVISYSMFPAAKDLPSSQWSLLNRTLMFLAGTEDARGFRQWNSVNRYVKRGAKCFHILVPWIRKVEDIETGEHNQLLMGFNTGVVFRVEDTDGEQLDYWQVDMPELPLIERAEEWGIKVKCIPGNFKYLGYYSSGRKEIGLASEEVCIFFHELSHCAHDIIKGGLKGGQDPIQEVIAELCAQTLCRIVGKWGDRYLGNSYRYIERYAEKLNLSPHAVCLRVMKETEEVLNLILKDDVVEEPLPMLMVA